MRRATSVSRRSAACERVARRRPHRVAVVAQGPAHHGALVQRLGDDEAAHDRGAARRLVGAAVLLAAQQHVAGDAAPRRGRESGRARLRCDDGDARLGAGSRAAAARRRTRPKLTTPPSMCSGTRPRSAPSTSTTRLAPSLRSQAPSRRDVERVESGASRAVPQPRAAPAQPARDARRLLAAARLAQRWQRAAAAALGCVAAAACGRRRSSRRAAAAVVGGERAQARRRSATVLAPAGLAVEQRALGHRHAEHLLEADRLGAELDLVGAMRLGLAALVLDRERAAARRRRGTSSTTSAMPATPSASERAAGRARPARPAGVSGRPASTALVQDAALGGERRSPPTAARHGSARTGAGRTACAAAPRAGSARPRRAGSAGGAGIGSTSARSPRCLPAGPSRRS